MMIRTMKNKNFFYLQYNKINWQNQQKTKINFLLYNFIIQEIILKKKALNIRVFDIGFGIGFFMRMLYASLAKSYKNLTVEGCEPSEKNYEYFVKKIRKNLKLKTYHKAFLDVQPDEKFDFITAIYVFPHFVLDDLEKIAKKIYSMLSEKGRFIMAVANEKYIKEKLKTKKDLFIEKNTIAFGGKKYEEILHYSDIPEIGKVIDYNREENFYIDLFKRNKFNLVEKKNFNDSGFICTIFVFAK